MKKKKLKHSAWLWVGRNKNGVTWEYRFKPELIGEYFRDKSRGMIGYVTETERLRKYPGLRPGQKIRARVQYEIEEGA